METKKTISQIALGLAVIGFGAGASAFTNKSVEAKRQAFVYHQLPDGSYTRNQPPGSNCTPQENPCTVSYSSAQSADQYNSFEDLPPGGIESTENGAWQ